MRSIIRSIKENLKGYLTFNYAERRGIMVLVMLIMIVETVNALLPAFISDESFDMSAFEGEIMKFEAMMALPDTLEKKSYNNTTSRSKQYPKQYTQKKKAYAGQTPLMIEINTADSALLIKLYGIGPSFAGRILKYRGMLGGFFSIDQLLEVYGMDSVRYAGIQKHVTADTSFILTIDVNTAEFKTLLRHPYLDYETVKSICNYREYSGPITCSDTLRKVIGYDPMWKKIKHYLEY